MERVILTIKKFLFTDTKADFTLCPMINEEAWMDMKRNTTNISWISPTSSTEYILTPNDTIYRRASNWGAVGSCYWTLNHGEHDGEIVVGKCYWTGFIPK